MSLALPPQTTISDLLLQGRRRLGGGDATRFPQPRMADLLGVSLRQYQRWERGDSRPSSRAAERIVRTLATEEPAPVEVASVVQQVEALQEEIRALRAELAAIREQRSRAT